LDLFAPEVFYFVNASRNFKNKNFGFVGLSLADILWNDSDW